MINRPDWADLRTKNFWLNMYLVYDIMMKSSIKSSKKYLFELYHRIFEIKSNAKNFK